ncbi:TIGR01777 family protein [Lottiidibacillus patelloidae]|uniref:TIGR01777 family protein n=1 Tax=Lottiidibacillus patelloidae TaxID=2670334 RepID=A0A263BTK7_9BACI|nr:TIGR01777 family oxidoreductase [Lottiidibacillus patelloidae]OZM57061.1 TIGR01777 family protein [Lottiidibacillus patelloidae]
MRIAISGGTGFIGKALVNDFTRKGHEVYVLSRSTKQSSTPRINFLTWNDDLQCELDGIDVFINLAGESLNSGRWTTKRKNRILKSRIEITHRVYTLLKELVNKPSVYINASAIGYYGTSEAKTFTEADLEHGIDFLAETVVAWEKEAQNVEQLGIRTVYSRFGVVLGTEGGAFPKMIMPYKFMIGGNVGSGKQWLSWIHIDDVVGLLQFAITNKDINGPINATAPNPVRNEMFGKAIAKTTGKPHWLSVPSFALHILLGEMSDLLLKGQKVLPEKALQHGYIFQYADINSALINLLNEEKNNETN